MTTKPEPRRWRKSNKEKKPNWSREEPSKYDQGRSRSKLQDIVHRATHVRTVFSFLFAFNIEFDSREKALDDTHHRRIRKSEAKNSCAWRRQHYIVVQCNNLVCPAAHHIVVRCNYLVCPSLQELQGAEWDQRQQSQPRDSYLPFIAWKREVSGEERARFAFRTAREDFIGLSLPEKVFKLVVTLGQTDGL